jgi:cytochrome d ubiquinol oxidase subunit I
MPDLLAARRQMALSLGFHIIFAGVGIAMPVLMVVAEWRYHRTGDAGYLQLAKRWATGTAVLFAVGAVSGTVLSFELGLLWPRFMQLAGPIIGLPFSLEGFAFFTEAIFLGVYLYGWDRISRRAHIAAGIAVAVSGAASGIFVVIVNAWMNQPAGIDGYVAGQLVGIDPLAAMATPAAFPQALHMTLASYASTGFAVAGIHAALLLRQPASVFHRRALSIALLVGAPAAILQPFSGDIAARFVAEYQPVKLAAMEGHFETMRGAPLHVGGWPDVARRETRWALKIPRGLSLLAFHDPNAEVAGLDQAPRDDWPPVAIVHVAFQVMIAFGSYMALIGLWGLWWLWRERARAAAASDAAPNAAGLPRLLLRALVLGAPMGFIAVEAGWVVTEVGRQPWIISGLLRTRDAVTPMPGLAVPFAVVTLVYVLLGVTVAATLWRTIVRPPASAADAGHA